MPNPLCSVCASSAALALVDGELLAGASPAAIFNQYGESLGLSRSAVYRHAAGAHSLPPTVDLGYVGGDTTVGDLVGDLAALRASLLEQRASLLERGQYALANGTALRIETVTATLLRDAGITEESQVRDREVLDGLRRVLGRTVARHPDTAAVLSNVATELRLDELAHDIDALAERSKENSK